LFHLDAHAGNVSAEWDQSNNYRGWPNDPEVITPSRFSRPLNRVLTDRDTFRFGVTMQITPGSVPDTTEFYQIANFGLYDLSQMGPDRLMNDNFSGNTVIVKDGSDFVEFNYFINNNSWGFNANIQPTIGTHITGFDGDYIVGSTLDAGFWHNTDMGADHWLPEGTNLYIEIVYYGGATNAFARRTYGAVYTEPGRTNLLTVNGVAMYYWTLPVPTTKTFCVSDFAFFNHVGANWGGVSGAGAGTYDDVYAERYVEPGVIFSNALQSGLFVTTWAAVSGQTYVLEHCTNLGAGVWETNAVIQAAGETLTFTNPANGKGGYYRVSF
jgi:hypothetical protein